MNLVIALLTGVAVWWVLLITLLAFMVIGGWKDKTHEYWEQNIEIAKWQCKLLEQRNDISMMLAWELKTIRREIQRGLTFRDTIDTKAVDAPPVGQDKGAEAPEGQDSDGEEAGGASDVQD